MQYHSSSNVLILYISLGNKAVTFNTYIMFNLNFQTTLNSIKTLTFITLVVVSIILVIESFYFNGLFNL